MSAKNITVLIPTYERPEYIHRNLSYMSRYFPLSDLRVMILDGSVRESEAVRKIASAFPVEYYHYAPDVSYVARQLDGLLKVQTPLVVMLADDDFLIPEGLFGAVDFLMENPDYSMASGAYASLNLENPAHFIIKPSYLQMCSIEEGNPLARLRHYFQTYGPFYYSVRRTASAVRAMTDALTYTQRAHPDFQQTHGELIIDFSQIIFGKYKKLPAYYYVREVGQSTDSYRNRLPAPRFLVSEYFAPEYRAFRNVMVDYLSEALHAEAEQRGELEEIFDLVHGVYVHTALTPDHLLERLWARTAFKDHLKPEKRRSLDYYVEKTRRKLQHRQKVARIEREALKIGKTPVVAFLKEYLAAPCP